MSKNLCPVCGFDDLNEQAYNPNGLGSYEICPSCGYEFGITDDDENISHKQWRKEWVSQGMPWRSTALPEPKDWNSEKQLNNLHKEK